MTHFSHQQNNTHSTTQVDQKVRGKRTNDTEVLHRDWVTIEFDVESEYLPKCLLVAIFATNIVTGSVVLVLVIIIIIITVLLFFYTLGNHDPEGGLKIR